MSALMEPSTTMKFLLPLVFVPVTVLTSAEAFPIMERPGSKIMVRPRSATRSRTVSTRSAGDGKASPLLECRHTEVESLQEKADLLLISGPSALPLHH